LPGSDQIPAEQIQTGGETLLEFTNWLIISGIRKSVVVPIYRKGDNTDCIISMHINKI
jgi:hypothetical protein